MSKEQFINQISHPRKREMATMILDGASFEEMQAQNFSRTSVQEMVAKIKVHVEGLEGFKVGSDTAIVETQTPTPTDLGPSDSGSSESGSSDSGPSDSGSSESKPIV